MLHSQAIQSQHMLLCQASQSKYFTVSGYLVLTYFTLSDYLVMWRVESTSSCPPPISSDVEGWYYFQLFHPPILFTSVMLGYVEGWYYFQLLHPPSYSWLCQVMWRVESTSSCCIPLSYSQLCQVMWRIESTSSCPTPPSYSWLCQVMCRVDSTSSCSILHCTITHIIPSSFTHTYLTMSI